MCGHGMASMGRLLTILLCVVSLDAVAADIQWNDSVQTALGESRATGKPMLIQLTADWCGYCRKMKAVTYTDKAVQQQVSAGFVPVLLDADENAALFKKLELRGLPATVVVAPDLRVLKKLNGYQRPEKLRTELSSVSAEFAKSKVAAVGYTKPVSAPAAAQTRPSTANAPAGRQAAFGGVCLVTLRDHRKLVRGDQQFSMTYRGIPVSFAGQEELRKFKASPEHYWPEHDGLCVVSAKHGDRVAGRPEFGVTFREHVWMFATQADMQAFVQDPQSYLP